MASRAAPYLTSSSIVKRYLAGPALLHPSVLPIAARLPQYSTTSTGETQQPSPTGAPSRKPSRASPASTSLRRTAIDAQRGRLQNPIQGRGRHRHLLPNTPTKNVTAYCAAETYQLSAARRLLQKEGYEPDPLGTGLGAQVLHVRMPASVTVDGTGRRGGIEHGGGGGGDLFVFPSGSVVAWNVPERVSTSIVQRVLPRAAENGHPARMEVEDMAYVETPHSESSEVLGDTIVLGTRSAGPPPPPASPSPSPSTEDTVGAPDAALDVTLAKIAFSSALARSTKLAVLEELLSAYFHSTRNIPSILSAGTPLRFTRRFILRKTGELLSIRAQLNLYSELTDSLPDIFWDSPHELGLESYYDSLGRALDVGVRIKVLNEKMDYASEIAAVLRERLSEKHSTGLEWLIIGLISIEVAFGVFHLWREGKEEAEMIRVRGLLERYLESETKATRRA